MKKKGAVDVIAKATTTNKPYSGYFDYSPNDLARLKQSLLSLRKAAPGKRIIVFTIPIESDWRRYNNTKSFPPLVIDLERFCQATDITYTDLLTNGTTEDLQQYKKQFFDCDMHWNEYGNQWTAKKLLPYFTKSK